MATQDSEVQARALKSLTYTFLAAGFIIILPFPLVGLLNVIFRHSPGSAFHPETLLASILAVGHLVLLFPVFTISLAALWVYKKTESHAAKFSVFKRGFQRFIPVAAIALIQAFITIRNGWVFVPLAFGFMLVAYGTWLLKLDGKAENPA